MSEHPPPGGVDFAAAPTGYDAPLGRRTPLAVVGGALSIAGCCLGLLLFLLACGGFDSAFILAPVPFAFGVVGFCLSVIAAASGGRGVGTTQILCSLFCGTLAVLGAFLEIAVWRGWPILFGAGGAR